MGMEEILIKVTPDVAKQLKNKGMVEVFLRGANQRCT